MKTDLSVQLLGTPLYRSRDSIIAGVCAGIADRLDFDAIVIRILALLLGSVTFGLVAIVYAALWLILPVQPESGAPYDITPERAESVTRGSLDCLNAGEPARLGAGSADGLSIMSRLAIAAGLMLLFLAVAINVSPIVSGTEWWEFWPLAFLIAGLCLIVVPVRTQFEGAWHAAGVVVASFAAMLLPMSLGVVSWDTLPNAFRVLWPLVVASIVLFNVGLYRESHLPVIAAASLMTLFCLLALLAFSVPGEVGTLYIEVPGDPTMRLMLVPFS